MQTVELNGRQTTQLGFGGSLLGSTTPAVSRALLNEAYDRGIRHFDVAPMYGFGRSERLLRDALGSRMREVTVTTKYGLEPPKNSRWIAPIHQLARAVLSPFPALKRRAQGAGITFHEEPQVPLVAKMAQASLDASLRELGVETIDLLLLHEATPRRLPDDELLEVLERSRNAGKIRQFGVGSRREWVADCLRETPQYCPVVQCEWSVFTNDQLDLAGRAKIHHGSLGGERTEFLAWLAADTARRAHWSEQVGYDLAETATVNRLILKAAIEHNRGGIVLFSTRTLANIRENVATAQDDRLAQPARTLLSLIQVGYRSRSAQAVGD